MRQGGRGNGLPLAVIAAGVSLFLLPAPAVADDSIATAGAPGVDSGQPIYLGLGAFRRTGGLFQPFEIVTGVGGPGDVRFGGFLAPPGTTNVVPTTSEPIRFNDSSAMAFMVGLDKTTRGELIEVLPAGAIDPACRIELGRFLRPVDLAPIPRTNTYVLAGEVVRATPSAPITQGFMAHVSPTACEIWDLKRFTFRRARAMGVRGVTAQGSKVTVVGSSAGHPATFTESVAFAPPRQTCIHDAVNGTFNADPTGPESSVHIGFNDSTVFGENRASCAPTMDLFTAPAGGRITDVTSARKGDNVVVVISYSGPDGVAHVAEREFKPGLRPVASGSRDFTPVAVPVFLRGLAGFSASRLVFASTTADASLKTFFQLGYLGGQELTSQTLDAGPLTLAPTAPDVVARIRGWRSGRLFGDVRLVADTTARARGSAGATTARVTGVQVAIRRRVRGTRTAGRPPRCLWIKDTAARIARKVPLGGVCGDYEWLNARISVGAHPGTGTWFLRLAHRLPPGNYDIFARGLTNYGVIGQGFAPRTGDQVFLNQAKCVLSGLC